MDCGKKTLFRCLNNKFIDIQYTPLGPLRHPPLMPLKSSSHPLQYPPLGLILFNILLSCLFNILLSSSSISSSHLFNILLSSSSISSSHPLQYPPLILFNILLSYSSISSSPSISSSLDVFVCNLHPLSSLYTSLHPIFSFFLCI